MSVVTDAILLLPSGASEEAIEFINEEALSGLHNGTKGFVSVKEASLNLYWYGGSKALQCVIAIGAFNYLDLSELLNRIHGLRAILETRYSVDSVQLVVQKEDSWGFELTTVYMN